MRRIRIFPLLFFLSVFLVLPVVRSQADVRVELKNGGSITADSCRESDGRLVCTRMGGFFEIEKADIAGIREIRGGSSEYSVEPSPDISGTDTKPARTGNAGNVTSDSPESREKAAFRRLEEIKRRKLELKNQREKLLAEREQLQADLKKAPDWMTVKQFDELTKRNADIDGRIKGFNEEVTALDQEENKVLGELNGGPAGTPDTSDQGLR